MLQIYGELGGVELQPFFAGEPENSVLLLLFLPQLVPVHRAAILATIVNDGAPPSAEQTEIGNQLFAHFKSRMKRS